jgi:hypothetical protein
MIRECRVQVEQRGFRVRTIIVATTLLIQMNSPKTILHNFIGEVERGTRFEVAETTLQMDVLRCKTPELVRRKSDAVLAYNLIRTVMARPLRSTASNRERSVSREHFKRSKPFNP